jgi:gamma-glutamyltranspeptidase/glutathione hydrolase
MFRPVRRRDRLEELWTRRRGTGDEVRRYLNLGIDKSDADGASDTGTRAMVVGSTGPFAQLAGRKVLEAGGSATDQHTLARLAPGGHLPFPANPAIALRAGRPVLASSSIGAGLHCATLHCLHAVLARGVPVNEVVRRPMFHGPDYLAGASVTTTLAERVKGKRVGSVWAGRGLAGTGGRRTP